MAQEPSKSVVLNLTVLSDKDTPAAAAEVFLFDNSANYDKSVAQTKAISPTDSYITDGNGNVTVSIEKDKSYYAFIIWKDTQRNIILTNESSNINNLPKNLKISTTIRLKPNDGTILFYSLANKSSKVPISISISGVSVPIKQSITVLSNAITIPSGVGSPGVANFSGRYGTYKYQAQNEDGCVWTDFISISRGELKLVELPSCSVGKVSFLASNLKNDDFPLNLSIDGVSFGQISNTSTSNIFNLMPGTYTYFATNTNVQKPCVWTSTFVIEADKTTDVLLPICR